MAVMDAVNRFRTWAQVMRQPELGPTGALTKVELAAVVNALDDWIEANQAAINSAIPQPARGILTLQQKTQIFCWVAMRRAGLYRAQED